MLLVDEQGTVIQGFIPPGRIDTYLPHMVAGSIYKLTNYYGSQSKVGYRVAEPNVIVTFPWSSILCDLKDSLVLFPEDRFRFYGYEEFEAACDKKGDLYDYIGHLKLVNGKTLSDSLVLDEDVISSTRRILVHVQTYDGPVMKLCLWDKAATDFCEKFKSHGSTPSVILVTTLNPKRIGGALTLNTLSPSRVFFDLDVQPTRDYLTWLSSNSDVANRVNADIVTKTETVTIGELFSYMKKEGAKANEGVGDDHVVPVPQALIDTIGTTHKFIVKVSTHNLTGKTKSLTVTKVHPPEAPVANGDIEENVNVPSTEEALQLDDLGDGHSIGTDESADERVKRSSDMTELEEAKRAKCG
ncbi:hypothetical protein Bca52824_022663 [Brassica carinata]|uniref:Uncharacterized protein n=1 Tax=Brassica carinata TaxID=52824 RepID=A0A8X7VH42_BRACI|nr:hypothetical protein Bca52824_022663 [Brassica carinata]